MEVSTIWQHNYVIWNARPTHTGYQLQTDLQAGGLLRLEVKGACHFLTGYTVRHTGQGKDNCTGGSSLS